MLILINCRTEDLLIEDNQDDNVKSSSTVAISKVNQNDIKKEIALLHSLGEASITISKKLRIGKNILEGAIFDSSFAVKVVTNVDVSYVFTLNRSNQEKFLENLVLRKKHGENKFKYFLYRYPRTKTYKYNFQKIEVYNLDKLSSQTGKLLYTEVTTSNGCYEITTISVNCGEGGNHSNGAFCEALNYSMALDYIVIKINCPESGGGPGDNNSGYYPGSPEDGGGSYDGNGTIAVPVEPIKKWNAGRFSVVNFLGLNYEQLRFMNAIENDEFRYEMVEFFNRNGIENPLENPSSEILSQEAVNVGKWIISYLMSNTMFLNSEYRNSFLKESLVFQNWSKNILTQNPNTNWDEFLS